MVSFLRLSTFLLGLVLMGVYPSSFSSADPLREKDNYQTLQIPVTEFGFRGVGMDGRGQIYLTSLLKNGIYILPGSCKRQECATFVRIKVPLSDPGQVVGLSRGGAFVLLRLADRVVYVPYGCNDPKCLRTIVLPRSPSYPSSGTVDLSTHNVWVTEQLADQISMFPPGCFRVSCMKSIDLPSKGAAPSGITVNPETGLWVTEKNRDQLAFIPRNCLASHCVQEIGIPLHLKKAKLHPFSPVYIGGGRVAFLLDGGRIVSVMKAEAQGISFSFMKLEKGIGRAVLITANRKGELVLLTKGSRLHVGKVRLTKDCFRGDGTSLASCVDLKSLSIEGGKPTGLMDGRSGEYWMTLRDSDQVVLFRLNHGKCFGSEPNLPAACFQKIAFIRQETLYHKQYHQEVSH